MIQDSLRSGRFCKSYTVIRSARYAHCADWAYLSTQEGQKIIEQQLDRVSLFLFYNNEHRKGIE